MAITRTTKLTRAQCHRAPLTPVRGSCNTAVQCKPGRNSSKRRDNTKRTADIRRKNVMEAEKRRQNLLDDPWTDSNTVQEKGVICLGCGKDIKLDARFEYYPGFWTKHKKRCPGINKKCGKAKAANEGKSEAQEVTTRRPEVDPPVTRALEQTSQQDASQCVSVVNMDEAERQAIEILAFLLQRRRLGL